MPSAASALFFLWSRSLWNLLRDRLRRLKQPKYLLGGGLAATYLFFVFVYPVMAARERASREAAVDVEAALLPRDPSGFVTSAAILLLLLAFTLMWLWRRRRAALHFSEAEIAFLFPGPVAHSMLVHYNLVRGQAVLVFSAFFTTLLTAGWSLSTPLWARFASWWLILAVITLHVTASGFTLTRLLNRGVAQWQRQLAVLALIALAAWVVSRVDPHLRWPTVQETLSLSAFFTYIADQIGSGPLYWLLLPLRALAAPLVAPDARAFLLAFVPALLVYALHYAWAVLSEVPDNEEAVALAAKRKDMKAALSKGNLRLGAPEKARPDPFPLAASGTPVLAFLWKNLLATRSYLRLRTALVLVVAIVAWNLWIGTPPRYGFFSFIPTLVAALLGVQTLLIGAQFARQDLRSDLDNVDIIKTWPLQGWQVVLGELLTPTLILSAFLWLCLLQISLSPASAPQVAQTVQMRIVGGLSLALVLPFLCAVQVLVANTAAVLFPAWNKVSGFGYQGLEVAGQRMIFFVAQVLVTLVALLPALLFGVLVYIPASWFVDNYAVLPAAIVTALVLAGELAWGINWLGERFDAYDLSS